MPGPGLHIPMWLIATACGTSPHSICNPMLLTGDGVRCIKCSKYVDISPPPYFIGSLEICSIVFENREKFAIHGGGRRRRMEGRVSRIEAWLRGGSKKTANLRGSGGESSLERHFVSKGMSVFHSLEMSARNVKITPLIWGPKLENWLLIR